MSEREPSVAVTRDLHVAYYEGGPPDGEPVLLVHGFPDDARTWDAVAADLAAAGYRTIVPFVRGFGQTRFVPGVVRTGEIAALARDVLALADSLEIERFHYVGHDWGARAGYGAAALAPRRVRSLTALGVAYGANAGNLPLPIDQTRAYWYQWYFATSRGEAELETNRYAFCRALWESWAPGWRFTGAEYDATAASFRNPDFVAVAISSYRQRWGFAGGAPAYRKERAVLSAWPRLSVPTLVLMGRDDGATLPSSADGKEVLFEGPYRLEIVPDSGHFIQRERPELVAERVHAHLRAYEGT